MSREGCEGRGKESTDSHNIIQLFDKVGWGWEYVMKVARIIPYGCLFVSIFTLKTRVIWVKHYR